MKGGACMKVQRCCRSCQHNFGDFCTAKGFGQTIESEDSICELWEISEDSLKLLLKETPWYLKRPYDNGKLELRELLDHIEEDADGKAISINLYDAIEEIYQMDQIQIAEVLGVSPDVVGYARSKGTVKRRIPHFAETLCIPEELFSSCTTADLETIRSSHQAYLKSIEKPEFLF